MLARAEARSVFDTSAERFGHVEVIGQPASVNSDRARNIEGLMVKLS